MRTFFWITISFCFVVSGYDGLRNLESPTSSVSQQVHHCKKCFDTDSNCSTAIFQTDSRSCILQTSPNNAAFIVPVTAGVLCVYILLALCVFFHKFMDRNATFDTFTLSIFNMSMMRSALIYTITCKILFLLNMYVLLIDCDLDTGVCNIWITVGMFLMRAVAKTAVLLLLFFASKGVGVIKTTLDKQEKSSIRSQAIAIICVDLFNSIFRNLVTAFALFIVYVAFLAQVFAVIRGTLSCLKVSAQRE